MGLLVAGLADGRQLLATAGDDRLHQRARSQLFPEAPALLDGLREAGALTSCWSGAGPSLLGICGADRATEVAAAAKSLIEGYNVEGDVLLLQRGPYRRAGPRDDLTAPKPIDRPGSEPGQPMPATLDGMPAAPTSAPLGPEGEAQGPVTQLPPGTRTAAQPVRKALKAIRSGWKPSGAPRTRLTRTNSLVYSRTTATDRRAGRTRRICWSSTPAPS